MRIRKRFQVIIVMAFFVVSMASTVAAQDDTAGSTKTTASSVDHGTFGIGVILGEPTGLSAKMWTTKTTGFDLGLAWSWSGDGHLHIHGDYLFHKFGFFDVSQGALPFYIGIGGRILLRDNADDRIGVRIPVGLEYYFDDLPIAVFGELVPILDLAPSTDFDINGGIGVRFYF